MKATVIVKLKEEVRDPAGEALVERLGSLGFSEISSARVGKFIELELHAVDQEDVQQRVEQMCKKLLSNEAIEEFEVEAEG